MRRSGLALLALLTLMPSCEESEPRPPQSPVGVAPSVVRPRDDGPCVVRATSLHDRPPLRLAVRERGPVAVEIYGDLHDVTLRMTKSARLDAASGPVRVAGWVEPASLSLYTTGAVAAGPLFVLTGHRDLSRDVRSWPTRADDVAKVSVDAPAGLSARPALADVPCAALSFEPTNFDPLPSVGKTATRSAAITNGRRIALHETDTGAPVGDLTLATESLSVSVLEERGERAHVAFQWGALLVHAWVKRDLLRDGPPEERAMVVLSTNADRFDAPAVTEVKVCTHDLPITVVEAGGRVPMPLGTLPAGAQVGIVLWDREQTKIYVQNAGIFPVEGATLLVATKQLDGCKAP